MLDWSVLHKHARGIALGLGAAVVAAVATWGSVSREYAFVGLCLVLALSVAGAVHRPAWLLGFWMATTPFASYVLRFPAERSLITYDRILIPAIILGFALRAPARGRAWLECSLFEAAWACFATVALINTIGLAAEKGQALRITIDAFFLPVLLFASLRRGFDPRRDGFPALCGLVALALALPWVGAAEFVLARDIMPFKGSSIFRTGIVRANGPFATDNSYAIISGLVALALFHAARLAGTEVSSRLRFGKHAAAAAAVVASLIPIFRTIMGALAVAYAMRPILELRVRTLARGALLCVAFVVASLPLLIPLSGTRVFADRISDPSSAFSRVATYNAAVDIISDHPFIGVGLMNYHDYFGQKHGTAWYIDVEAIGDIGAESYPHNNVLGLAAEIGIAGAFFYLLAGLSLALAAFRRGDVAALALMAVYWITGMTLYSGIYADLNLYYFAFLGMCAARWRQGTFLDMPREDGR